MPAMGSERKNWHTLVSALTDEELAKRRADCARRKQQYRDRQNAEQRERELL